MMDQIVFTRRQEIVALQELLVMLQRAEQVARSASAQLAETCDRTLCSEAACDYRHRVIAVKTRLALLGSNGLRPSHRQTLQLRGELLLSHLQGDRSLLQRLGRHAQAVWQQCVNTEPRSLSRASQALVRHCQETARSHLAAVGHSLGVATQLVGEAGPPHEAAQRAAKHWAYARL